MIRRQPKKKEIGQQATTSITVTAIRSSMQHLGVADHFVLLANAVAMLRLYSSLDWGNDWTVRPFTSSSQIKNRAKVCVIGGNKRIIRLLFSLKATKNLS